MRVTLTDRFVASAKASGAAQADFFDDRTPGLALRVSAAGRKTWTFTFTSPGSAKRARITLGTYPAQSLARARGMAIEARRDVEAGRDPRARSENAFGIVAEEFIAFVKREKLRKADSVERELRKDVIPHWKNKAITEITPPDVARVVDAIISRDATYQAHNVFGHIRRLFNWAIARGKYGLDYSPCDRLKPKDLIGKRAMRSRILKADEIRAFWSATARMQYPYGPLFRLLLVTIQRRGEVSNVVKSELNLQDGLWEIPAKRMKMDTAHVVPLSSLAVELFRSLPAPTKGRLLFSTTNGELPVDGFAKAKVRLDKLMLEELRELAKSRGDDPHDVELEDFVLHDLRRTGRTALSSLPVSDPIVRELVIAHTKPGLHKVYDQHAYLDEKRQLLDQWAIRLKAIVEPKANVVAFAKARA